MFNWLYEILIVISFSKRTVWAIITGILFFLIINIWGDHAAANFELPGLYAGFSDLIKHKIISKYDKLAWSALISFLVLAVKLYRKDKKRIFYN